MIARWYEVTCDYCGCGINHYVGRRPTKEMLEGDGVICTATKQFCSDECYGNWSYDRQAKQYWNLKQHGKIHNE